MKNALIVFKPEDIGEERTLTLAADVKTRDDDRDYHIVSFGLSLKNPTDKESKQDLGDTIAKGRAQKKPTFVLLTSGESISRNLIEKVAAVFKEEVGAKVRNYVPFKDKKKVPTSKPV